MNHLSRMPSDRQMFWKFALILCFILWMPHLFLASCQLNESQEEGTATPTPTSGSQTTGTPSPTAQVTPTSSGDFTLGPEEAIPYDGDFLSLDADPSGNLYLAYFRSGWIHFVIRSNDVWSQEIDVPDSGDAADRFYCGVACGPDGTAHFIWVNSSWNTVWHRQYLNGSWGPKEKAIEGIHPTNRPDIDIAPDGTIYVISQKDYGIAYGVNRNGSWYSGDYIFYSTPSEPQYPRIAAAPDNSARSIFSSFFGAATATGELGYSEYNPSSNTWSPAVAPFLLDDYPGIPEIMIDRQGRSHILWMEWTEEYAFSKIGYSVLENGQWSPVYYVVETPFIGFLDAEPHMYFVQGDGDTYCLSVPRFGSVYHNAYFYLKKGESWIGPHLITTASMQQRYPALAFSEGRFHYCWRDLRGTLYYRSIQP